MAKQPTITTVTSGYYGRQALNTNFENIRDQFDNTLSLDGSTPNAMNADFDLNGNDLLNAKDGEFTNSLTVKGVDVLDALGGSVGAATVFKTTNRFTGDGSTVAFTLSKTPAARANTDVFINGIYQQKDTYTVSGTTLTFTEAPPAVGFEVVIYEAIDVGTVQASDVSTADGQDVQARLDQAAYATRAAFTADVASGKVWVAGDIVAAANVLYQYDGVTTDISDLPGWKPFGRVMPDHWVENNNPGTTDMYSAIKSATDYVAVSGEPVDHGGGVVWLDGKYAVGQEVQIISNNITLRGSGKAGTQIVSTGLTGNVIKFGDETGSATYSNLLMDMTIVVPQNTVRTSGAHVQFRNVTGGGIYNVDFHGFYGAVDIKGSAHLILDNLWFRGRNRNGASNKSAYCIQVDGDTTTGRGCTGIYINKVDGVANNSITLGWVENFLYVRECDGIYITDFHSNLADWAITIEAHDDSFMGEFRLQGFYLDKSAYGNMRIIGNTTQAMRTITLKNGLMRAAGGAGAEITDSTACSLYVEPGVDGIDILDIENVRFDAPQGEAIRCNNSTTEVLRIRNCTFEDVNEGGNTGIYELKLSASYVYLDNNTFIRGDSNAANTVSSIYFSTTPVEASLGVINDGLSDVVTRISNAGTTIDYGVGGWGGYKMNYSNDWDSEDKNGIHVNTDAGATGVPTAVANWHGITLTQGSTTRSQLAFRPDDMRFRRMTASTYGDWARVFHTLNATDEPTGTQAAPTGGLMYSYDSGNWVVEKYANGIMKMSARFTVVADITTAWGAFYTSGNLLTGLQTYPETFAATPAANITVTANGVVVSQRTGGTGDTNNLPSSVYSFNTASTAAVTHYINVNVTGKWT